MGISKGQKKKKYCKNTKTKRLSYHGCNTCRKQLLLVELEEQIKAIGMITV